MKIRIDSTLKLKLTGVAQGMAIAWPFIFIGAYHLSGFFVQASVVEKAALMASFFFGQMGIFFFVGLSGIISDTRTFKQMEEGFLLKFNLCDFIEFKIEDFSPDAEKILYYSQFRRPYGWIKRKDERAATFRIFVIGRGRSKVLPKQLVAFNYHLSPSFLFVRDNPEKLDALGKFFLFHEIAHCSWQSSLGRILGNEGWEVFAVLFFWLLWNVQITSFTVVLHVIYFGLVLYPFLRHKFNWLVRQTLEEMNADKFAVSFLSLKERRDLLEYLDRVVGLPVNKVLGEYLTKVRSNNLIEKLKNLDFLLITDPESFSYQPSTSQNQIFLGVLLIAYFFFPQAPTSLSVMLNALFFCTVYGVLIWVSEKREKNKLMADAFFSS